MAAAQRGEAEHNHTTHQIRCSSTQVQGSSGREGLAAVLTGQALRSHCPALLPRFVRPLPPGSSAAWALPAPRAAALAAGRRAALHVAAQATAWRRRRRHHRRLQRAGLEPGRRPRCTAGLPCSLHAQRTPRPTKDAPTRAVQSSAPRSCTFQARTLQGGPPPAGEVALAALAGIAPVGCAARSSGIPTRTPGSSTSAARAPSREVSPCTRNSRRARLGRRLAGKPGGRARAAARAHEGATRRALWRCQPAAPGTASCPPARLQEPGAQLGVGGAGQAGDDQRLAGPAGHLQARLQQLHAEQALRIDASGRGCALRQACSDETRRPATMHGLRKRPAEHPLPAAGGAMCPGPSKSCCPRRGTGTKGQGLPAEACLSRPLPPCAPFFLGRRQLNATQRDNSFGSPLPQAVSSPDARTHPLAHPPPCHPDPQPARPHPLHRGGTETAGRAGGSRRLAGWTLACNGTMQQPGKGPKRLPGSG